MNISHEWSFGDNKELADKLVKLVLSGKKTATTGLYYEDKKLPRVCDFEAILNSNHKRTCIIQCTAIEVKSFLEVTFDFIQKEGENDKDVEEWRKKHREFFHLANDNVKVVCQEFKVISVLNRE